MYDLNFYTNQLKNGLESVGFEIIENNSVLEIHRGGKNVKVGGYKLALPTKNGSYKIFNPLIDMIPLNGIISGNTIMVYGALNEWATEYTNPDPVIKNMINKAKFSNGLGQGVNQDFIIKHHMPMTNELKQWLRRHNYKVKDDGTIIKITSSETGLNVTEELFNFIKILQSYLNGSTELINPVPWSKISNSVRNLFGTNELNRHTKKIKSQVYQPLNIKLMAETPGGNFNSVPTPSVPTHNPAHSHHMGSQPTYPQQPIPSTTYPQHTYPQPIHQPPPGYIYDPNIPPWETGFVPENQMMYRIASQRLI